MKRFQSPVCNVPQVLAHVADREPGNSPAERTASVAPIRPPPVRLQNKLEGFHDSDLAIAIKLSEPRARFFLERVALNKRLQLHERPRPD